MNAVYQIEVLLTGVLGMLLAWIVILRIFQVSFRCRLFDHLDSRKIHGKFIPRLGGVAFFPCIVVAVSLVAISHHWVVGPSDFGGYMAYIQLLTLFTALFLVYFMGIMDDLIGVHYRTKSLVQMFCGLLMGASGCGVANLHGLFGLHGLSPWACMLLSVFMYVYVMNAFNFIDGIDGLAAGLGGIAFAALAVIFVAAQWWLYAYIASASVGVLATFFYFNVYGNRHRGRRIFMGDTGSLTIGLLLTFLVMTLSACPPKEGLQLPDAFFVALSFLIVPLFDVVWVVVGRMCRGRSPFLPDRTHIHHQVLALGLSQRKAMLAIIGMALALALFNVLLMRYLPINLLFALDVLLWVAIRCVVVWKLRRSRRE